MPEKKQLQKAPTQVQPVASGKVKKKSLGTKVKETFLTSDLPDVKSNIVNDILIPSAKNMVLDAVRSITNSIAGTVELTLFGKISRGIGSGPHVGSIGSRIRYEDAYRGGGARRELTSTQRATFAIDEIVFEGIDIVNGIERNPRQQAQAVIDSMIDHIEMYTYATVRDFYDFCGVTTRDYTESSYGWRSFSGARAEPISGGRYIIVCPKPDYLGTV